MTPSLTQTLCTRCGLCCDGTLFADVQLVGPAEATRLEIMGIEVDGDAADAGLLSQPCAALRGRQCTIYAHRPKCCRQFECQLLQDAQLGAVTVERALELIAEARSRIQRVRDLLSQLGQRHSQMPLKERCAEALAAEAGAAPGLDRKRTELRLEMAAVERLTWRWFLGGGGDAGARGAALTVEGLLGHLGAEAGTESHGERNGLRRPRRSRTAGASRPG